MNFLKTKSQKIIDSVRNNPDKFGLKFREFGKSTNIRDYSDDDINEMLYGVYKKNKILLVDDDYFIEVNNVKQVICELEYVTYKKKPSSEEINNNIHNSIKNIRTFYVSNYFIITEKEFNQKTKHKISGFLSKQKIINKGRNQFSEFYGCKNCTENFKWLNGKKYPKDLFHPIKLHINKLFFNDGNYITNFIVKSKIDINGMSNE
ncbi:hypothetical protein [uncultured Flavobacterium sp.]|uniref:hypothetical protein n=1 Tax=uncultured Flavobacterium sp. TaxID=165435 RepID=UPI0025DB0F6D|nr:hypothetical protein [uncultured Flavobacterium sp.]